MAIFQADSEQLQEIARAFQGEADCVRQMLQNLSTQTENLQGYGWVGLGANAYFDEFDSHIRPALTALLRFLEAQATESNRIAQQIEDRAEGIISHARSAV